MKCSMWQIIQVPLEPPPAPSHTGVQMPCGWDAVFGCEHEGYCATHRQYAGRCEECHGD